MYRLTSAEYLITGGIVGRWAPAGQAWRGAYFGPGGELWSASATDEPDERIAIAACTAGPRNLLINGRAGGVAQAATFDFDGGRRVAMVRIHRSTPGADGRKTNAESEWCVFVWRYERVAPLVTMRPSAQPSPTFARRLLAAAMV